MDSIRQFMEQYQGWIVALGVGGLAVSVLGLLTLPFFVARLPANYFEHEELPGGPRLSPALRVLRNFLGLLVVLAGVAMLVLPGQGILTILAGLVLMEFPGKRRLERSLVARPRVLKALNWVRHRGGAEDLRPVQR